MNDRERQRQTDKRDRDRQTRESIHRTRLETYISGLVTTCGDTGKRETLFSLYTYTYIYFVTL